jgi:hypothetical protein
MKFHRLVVDALGLPLTYSRYSGNLDAPALGGPTFPTIRFFGHVTMWEVRLRLRGIFEIVAIAKVLAEYTPSLPSRRAI